MSRWKKWGIIVRSIIIAYGITLLLFLAYSFVLAHTSVPESTISSATLIITAISIFLSSSLAMIQMKENGLMNGALVGVLYVLLLYVISSIFVTGFGLNGYAIGTIALSVIIGMMGGVIGVNLLGEGRSKK